LLYFSIKNEKIKQKRARGREISKEKAAPPEKGSGAKKTIQAVNQSNA
jgi:hypothetical protein